MERFLDIIGIVAKVGFHLSVQDFIGAGLECPKLLNELAKAFTALARRTQATIGELEERFSDASDDQDKQFIKQLCNRCEASLSASKTQAERILGDQEHVVAMIEPVIFEFNRLSVQLCADLGMSYNNPLSTKSAKHFLEILAIRTLCSRLRDQHMISLVIRYLSDERFRTEEADASIQWSRVDVKLIEYLNKAFADTVSTIVQVTNANSWGAPDAIEGLDDLHRITVQAQVVKRNEHELIENKSPNLYVHAHKRGWVKVADSLHGGDNMYGSGESYTLIDAKKHAKNIGALSFTEDKFCPRAPGTDAVYWFHSASSSQTTTHRPGQQNFYWDEDHTVTVLRFLQMMWIADATKTKSQETYQHLLLSDGHWCDWCTAKRYRWEQLKRACQASAKAKTIGVSGSSFAGGVVLVAALLTPGPLLPFISFGGVCTFGGAGLIAASAAGAVFVDPEAEFRVAKQMNAFLRR